ncbi:MAG: agmatinase [Gemmatimonadaceae bacterium]
MTSVLLGIPYDKSSSFKRGAAKAPRLIRKALHSAASNSWSEAILDTGRPEVLEDGGDLKVPENAARARASIEAGIRKVVATGKRPISLGGDHSITYPILKGFGQAARPLTVLQLDAHGDLYSEFEGDRYSHACPFTRILEDGLIARLVQVGIRTLNAEQRDNAARFGVETIDMRDWAAGARPSIQGPVYLSIDMDGLDPAFAPGVSHREPGGLTVRDVLTLIQSISGPVLGADVVEFNPSQDPVGLTAPVCAKIVKELATVMATGRQPGVP